VKAKHEKGILCQNILPFPEKIHQILDFFFGGIFWPHLNSDFSLMAFLLTSLKIICHNIVKFISLWNAGAIPLEKCMTSGLILG
jgi:hypothetical protein